MQKKDRVIGPDVKPTTTQATGIWYLEDQQTSKGAGSWVNPPGAAGAGGSTWQLILDVSTATTGTLNVTGNVELLFFGVGCGGAGGSGGDDDGGGGGGGGAAQLDGYKANVTGFTSIYYSVSRDTTAGTTNSNPSNPSTIVRQTNSSGSIVFELNSGARGARQFPNAGPAVAGGPGGASNSYSSDAGTNGGSGATRTGSAPNTNGVNGTNAASGGGGGGAWLGTNTGKAGGTSTISKTVSTFNTYTLSPSLTASGVAGGSGGNGYPSSTSGGTSGTLAVGGTNGPTYCGGGGGGGGIRFFSAGSYHGGGGGGGGGQGGTGGSGGTGRLIVYGR